MLTIVEQIKSGLAKHDPNMVAWRSLLESALFEIQSLERSRDYYKREMENWKNIRHKVDVLAKHS